MWSTGSSAICILGAFQFNALLQIAAQFNKAGTHIIWIGPMIRMVINGEHSLAEIKTNNNNNNTPYLVR